jgi:hypothetical protein
MNTKEIFVEKLHRQSKKTTKIERKKARKTKKT